MNDLLAKQEKSVARWAAAKKKAKPRIYSPYTEQKKAQEARVLLHAKQQGLKPIRPSHWAYMFIELSRHRDPSNFVAAGTKLIEDALQEKRARARAKALGHDYVPLLENDGWKHILSLSPHWMLCDKEHDSGVFVVMDTEPVERGMLMDLLDGRKR